MAMLFALLPTDRAPDDVWNALSSEARDAVPLRVYPIADERQRLLSIVRDGRDRHATRWLRGIAMCIVGGAGIGAVTATTLAVGFDMLGGMAGVGFAFGAAVGAFLGGFTAAMNGTERAREELVALADRATYPCRLLQAGPMPHGDPRLVLLRERCDALDVPRCVCDG